MKNFTCSCGSPQTVIELTDEKHAKLERTLREGGRTFDQYAVFEAKRRQSCLQLSWAWQLGEGKIVCLNAPS